MVDKNAAKATEGLWGQELGLCQGILRRDEAGGVKLCTCGYVLVASLQLNKVTVGDTHLHLVHVDERGIDLLSHLNAVSFGERTCKHRAELFKRRCSKCATTTLGRTIGGREVYDLGDILAKQVISTRITASGEDDRIASQLGKFLPCFVPLLCAGSNE